MAVIPFPAGGRHWRRRPALSVRAALAMIGGFILLFWGAVAWLVSLAVGP